MGPAQLEAGVNIGYDRRLPFSMIRRSMPLSLPTPGAASARSFRLRFPEPAVEAAYLAFHRKESVQVARWAVVAAFVMGMFFVFQDNVITPTGYRATNIRMYLMAPLCFGFWFLLGAPRLQRFVEPLTGLFILLYGALVVAIFVVFEPTFYGLSGPVAEGNFVILIMATFTMSHLRLGWASAVAAGVMAMYMAGNYLWTAADFELFLNGHYANAAMACVLGAATGWMFEVMRRRQFLTVRALEGEKERYKGLLFTLVPSQITDRIKEGQVPIADSNAEIAILFADIVGFTALSKQVAPGILVQLLNELFFEFDLAAERYGVEKIKTVGDGYMAVCGPPVAEQRRAVCVAQFALEMVQITRRMAARFNLPIGIRVGVHSGSLVAGVIGKSRYTYDMWGESVNMASRMEASGVADRVQLSDQAQQRLGGQFACEPHAVVDVGGQQVRTWLLGEALL
jgi:adenylate cyclase